MSRKSYVDYSDKDRPLLRVEIDGALWGFSVRWIPESDHEWLADVVEKQMQAVHDRATIKAVKGIQKALRELAGLE